MVVKQDIDTERGMDDITDILHNQGVADLSWLQVDEETYRQYEALPQQNHDIIPELQHALRQDPKEPVPSVIPLRPHTIVNTKSTTAPFGVVEVRTPIRNRVSSYVMSGLGIKEIQQKLHLEFSEADLRLNVSTIKEVLDERGVLGNVYINSSHFPKCAQNGKDVRVAKSQSKKALFVLAKSDCSGCVCNKNGNCSAFKKRLVGSVPYDERTASHYASQFEMEGRKIEAVGDVKRRLQLAFLHPSKKFRAEPIITARSQNKIEKIEPTKKQFKEYLARQSAKKPQPLPGRAYIGYARRMMAGLNDTEILATSTDPELRSLVRDFGLLGHTYLDMDSLGGCRKTLAFIEERKLNPNFLVRRNASCGICMDMKDGACAKLCEKFHMVSDKPDIDRHTFGMALERAMLEHRVTNAQAHAVSSNIRDNMNWVKLTSQLNLVKPLPDEVKVYEQTPYSFHHGKPGSHTSSTTMDPAEIHRTVSHFMNTGLGGRHLIAAIQSRYTKSDLIQAPEVGRFASENQGIQGRYFIDPTVYPDYGKGCNRGASAFRKKSIPYVKIGPSCTGCNFQLAPGKCSKFARDLIREVPEEVRVQYRKVSLPVVQEVQNPVEQYGVSSDDMSFQIEKVSTEFDIQIASSELPDNL